MRRLRPRDERPFAQEDGCLWLLTFVPDQVHRSPSRGSLIGGRRHRRRHLVERRAPTASPVVRSVAPVVKRSEIGMMLRSTRSAQIESPEILHMALKERLKMWLNQCPQNERRHAGRLQNPARLGLSGRSVGEPCDVVCRAHGHDRQLRTFEVAPEKAIELAGRSTRIYSAWEASRRAIRRSIRRPKNRSSCSAIAGKRCWACSIRLSEEDLAKPIPEGGPAFLTDNASMFELLAWHEGLHCGPDEHRPACAGPYAAD